MKIRFFPHFEQGTITSKFINIPLLVSMDEAEQISLEMTYNFDDLKVPTLEARLYQKNDSGLTKIDQSIKFNKKDGPQINLILQIANTASNGPFFPDGNYYLKVTFVANIIGATETSKTKSFVIKFRTEGSTEQGFKIVNNTLHINEKNNALVFFLNLGLLLFAYWLWITFKDASQNVFKPRSSWWFNLYPLAIAFFLVNVDQLRKVFSNIRTFKEFIKYPEFSFGSDTFQFFAGRWGVVCSILLLLSLVSYWILYAPLRVIMPESGYYTLMIGKQKLPDSVKLYQRDLKNLRITLNPDSFPGFKMLPSSVGIAKKNISFTSIFSLKALEARPEFHNFYIVSASKSQADTFAFTDDEIVKFRVAAKNDPAYEYQEKNRTFTIRSLNQIECQRQVDEYLRRLEARIDSIKTRHSLSRATWESADTTILFRRSLPNWNNIYIDFKNFNDTVSLDLTVQGAVKILELELDKLFDKASLETATQGKILTNSLKFYAIVQYLSNHSVGSPSEIHNITGRAINNLINIGSFRNFYRCTYDLILARYYKFQQEVMQTKYIDGMTKFLGYKFARVNDQHKDPFLQRLKAVFQYSHENENI